MGACAAEIQCEPIVSLDPRIVGTKTGPLTGMMCAKEQLAEDCPDGDEKSDVSDVENPDFLNNLPSSGDGGDEWKIPSMGFPCSKLLHDKICINNQQPPHTHTHTHTHIHTHTHTIHTQTHTHIHMNACMHACTTIHMYCEPYN